MEMYSFQVDSVQDASGNDVTQSLVQRDVQHILKQFCVSILELKVSTVADYRIISFYSRST